MNIVSRVQEQAIMLKKLRSFFDQEGFLEVMPPPMVENPGMEVHITPFKINNGMYLHTSPEFAMKELLSNGAEKIYTINFSFRDEPIACHHRPQFLMLEWYRANECYTKIMDDCENLFRHLSPINKYSFERATIAEIFRDWLGVEILDYLESKDLRELIKRDFKDVPLPTEGESLSYDDCFFLLFLNKIEPKLKQIPYLLLYEFPYHLAALSTLKKEDPRVCERFEIYCHGIELCNSFNELTDFKIQEKRFLEQQAEKIRLYGINLPMPSVLMSSLERGLPPSAGIALGVERLIKIISHVENPFYY